MNYHLRKNQTDGVRISLLYKLGLLAIMERFPENDYVIVLEEDVLVAPDFMRSVIPAFP